MCAWLFHMNVATRSPCCTPNLVSAAANRSARLETWKNVASSTPSGVTVSTFFSEYDVLTVADDAADEQWRVLHRALH